MDKRSYLAIDLKSFYASAECVSRGLDPLDTNLVVADPKRSNKTICLAVSPSLKAYGIGGRPRLFELEEKVKEINFYRRKAAGGTFTGSSSSAAQLKEKAGLSLDYIIAPPRMSYYLEVSRQVVGVYLDYVSIDDMHLYSVDEVFIDISDYLPFYKMTAHSLACRMIKSVLEKTGITATAGIGSNLYLAKLAMDIVAKKKPADKDGIRLAELDEKKYKALLWDHRPLTDFWQIGRGIASKLAGQGLYTMRDIAACSIGGSDEYYNEDLLYKLFGVKAELLIDHAWGRESCRMEDIKNYKAGSKSLSQGQVMSRPYTFKEGEIIIKEMADSLAMSLMKKGFYTKKLVLTIGYEKLSNNRNYEGPVKTDYLGRKIPLHARGTINLDRGTSLADIIIKSMLRLYRKITDPKLLIRRFNLSASALSCNIEGKQQAVQLNFINLSGRTGEDDTLSGKDRLDKELSRYRLQETILRLKEKYGKNAVLKALNFEEGATMRERNGQIGGHKA